MAMTAKHTTGPWNICRTTYDGATIGFEITAAPMGSVDPICETRLKTQRNSAEIEANSNLIAAAPDLLDALENCLRMLEAAHRQLGMYTKSNPRIAKASAAIAKAKGE
jgi:hypothetical protein